MIVDYIATVGDDVHVLYCMLKVECIHLWYHTPGIQSQIQAKKNPEHSDFYTKNNYCALRTSFYLKECQLIYLFSKDAILLTQFNCSIAKVLVGGCSGWIKLYFTSWCLKPQLLQYSGPPLLRPLTWTAIPFSRPDFPCINSFMNKITPIGRPPL